MRSQCHLYYKEHNRKIKTLRSYNISLQKQEHKLMKFSAVQARLSYAVLIHKDDSSFQLLHSKKTKQANLLKQQILQMIICKNKD